ncbi:MAG TPA: helix-turn-helix domain-containing protein [Ktedonobacterales bacterium]|nr:helix-turn-helix domain-containing protein [Ktedonobacterales bacterium]
MRSYGQYCPIAKATEIFADRWTPLIIREMLDGTCHFNDLERGLPGISRSLLAERLRRLERAGVVERSSVPNRHATEYHLTLAGEQLKEVIDVLGRWGARWAFGDPVPEELDPALLMWWMRRRVQRNRLPPQRLVVQFDFRGQHTGSYWLVMEPAEVSVCLQHPGFAIDLLVTADIAACYRVLFSRLTLAEALRAGLIEVDGPTPLVRSFPTWWTWFPTPSAERTPQRR